LLFFNEYHMAVDIEYTFNVIKIKSDWTCVNFKYNNIILNN